MSEAKAGNVTVDFTLQHQISEPFPRHLLEPILIQTMTTPNFHYGVVASNDSRRRIVYHKLLELLEELVKTIERFVKKVVADAIYFKNGSYIKIYSPSTYEHNGRGYRFDRTMFDEGTLQLYERSYISSERYQSCIYETPLNPCVVAINIPQEPQINEKAWEEMILNGIKTERTKHYI